ncbi:hypothetical protein BU17DRAFT_60049 [Hysterangium stoloniferum]|nr:hypothetical protein BU17DRAFT_60049 [Hysterangium stoloniferum]
MEREVVVADDERVSMARDDGLVMWPGNDTRPRDWSRVYAAYSTTNGISTSGTCKFARDGPSYAIRQFRIPDMDMGLYFYEEWQMTGSSDFTLYCPPGACSS